MRWYLSVLSRLHVPLSLRCVVQVRPPMPPVYFFVIDVSAAAYACGMVSVVASTIKACLDQLPGDERTLVGFITYDASLHFYNLKANLAAPQVGGGGQAGGGRTVLLCAQRQLRSVCHAVTSAQSQKEAT
jgi:hypothetical protein